MLYEDGSEELYDLISDPNEWTNIANVKGAGKIKNEFKKAIPQKQVPLSKVSHYNINAYWRAKVKEAAER